MRIHRLGGRFASVLLAAAIAVPLAAVVSGGSAFGTTYTVPCNGGDPTALIAAVNNANATPTTADAINLAANCTYIFGGYDNTTDGGNALPVITSPITINGNGSTLERGGLGIIPNFRLIEVSPNGTLTTNYLTLTGGLLESSPASAGAGILNYGRTNLRYSKVLDNHVAINDIFALPIGGGIANINPGVLSVSNSDVSYNSASIPSVCGFCGPSSYLGIPLGGGIANSGTVSIGSSTITNNRADADGVITFAFGGGIASGAASAPTVAISSSKLTDNTVSGLSYGFGLAVGGGFAGNALNMASTEVARNTATELAQYQGVAFGGGVAVTRASNISSSSSIHDNTASGYYASDSAGGGVGVAAGAALTINSSAIFNNTVGPTSNSIPTAGSVTGGGIHNAGILTLNTTRVSGNSAVLNGSGGSALGGGIYNASGGTVKLNSSSVKGNSAATDAGGVYNADASPTAVSGTVTSITTNTPDNCVNVSGCVG